MTTMKTDTLTQQLSARTLAEMAAGAKVVRNTRRSGDIAVLRAVGLGNARDLDDEALENNINMVKTLALPIPDQNYRCGICWGFHKLGQRCPNSARKHVRNWSDPGC